MALCGCGKEDATAPTPKPVIRPGFTSTLRDGAPVAGCSAGLDAQGVWQNHGHAYHCTPGEVFMPKTQQEVVKIVDQALANKKKVRPVGTGSSGNAYCECEGQYLVLFKNMSKVTLSPDKQQVTVEPGALLADVHRALAGSGRAWPVAPLDPHMTVVGAVSTAAHGGGKDACLLSDLVERIDLVGYREGRACVITLQASDQDQFKAAQVSLGCLGLIVSLTLRTLEDYGLVRRDALRPRSLLTSEEDMHNLVWGHDHVQITWFPHQPDVWVRSSRKASPEDHKKLTRRGSRPLSGRPRTSSGGTAGAAPGPGTGPPHTLADAPLDLVDTVGGPVPFSQLSSQPAATVKAASARVVEALRARLEEGEVLVQASNVHSTGQAFTCTQPYRSCGFCFPIPSKTFGPVVEAWEQLLRLVGEAEERGEQPLNLLARMTFVRGGSRDASPLLSPCVADSGHCMCCVEIMSAYRESEWEDFMQAVSRCWMRLELTSFPQWEREFPATDELFDHVRDCYGQRLARFQAVRKQMDPSQLFANNYLMCIFGG